MDKVITLPDSIVSDMKKEAIDMGLSYKQYIEKLVLIGRQSVLSDLKPAKKKTKK